VKLERGSIAALTVAVALSLSLSACGSDDNSGSLNAGGGGATPSKAAGVACEGELQLKASGSTAQANAMTVFKNNFAASCPGANVDYTANGSGQGISEFLAGLTDFAGSDSPLSADQAKKAADKCGSPALNLPVVFGPIAVAYKLPGGLRINLSAPTVAKIFTGGITKWNAPEIAAENRGASLPDLPITVVFRADESGTTDNFQKYLAAAAPQDWTHGAGKAFKGGTGQGANGNPQVAATVNKADGAITYAEWSFAEAQHLQVANIITTAGPTPVKLDADAVGRTIAGARFTTPGSADLVLDTTAFYRPTAEGAYPIVLAGYQVVCSKYADPQVGAAVRTFLGVAANEASQGQLPETGYAPIPDAFRTTLLRSIDSINR
jgi:phosphate transport system substrate-binding protein